MTVLYKPSAYQFFIFIFLKLSQAIVTKIEIAHSLAYGYCFQQSRLYYMYMYGCYACATNTC